MKKKYGILFMKVAALLLPLAFLLGTYLYYDPFRVIYHYDNYYKNSFIDLNRDFVSTQMYLRHKLKYNAFIFGSSRSRSFLCKDWKQYIPMASPFHYDASGETLKGIVNKINLIDREGKLDYALLLLDHYILESPDYLTGPLYTTHPCENNQGWTGFQFYYFRSYLSEFFFVKYIDYYHNHTLKPYLRHIIMQTHYDYDPVNNDYYMRRLDEEVQRDPAAYLRNHRDYFSQRDTSNLHVEIPHLFRKQIKMLQQIKNIFDKHHTQYKIVLLPDYYEYFLDANDMATMRSIFGKENVYDFSGKNAYSDNIENFYETIHFRPKAASSILQEVYKK